MKHRLIPPCNALPEGISPSDEAPPHSTAFVTALQLALEVALGLQLVLLKPVLGVTVEAVSGASPLLRTLALGQTWRSVLNDDIIKLHMPACFPSPTADEEGQACSLKRVERMMDTQAVIVSRSILTHMQSYPEINHTRDGSRIQRKRFTSCTHLP